MNKMQLPQGMAYGWWHFQCPKLDSLSFAVSIAGNVDRTPGRYLQLYQGQIADVGMYFGFQTDVFRPNVGWTGHGLIFSRWGTRNPEDARAVNGGWIENAGHEGDFVGVRAPMHWGVGSYECQLVPTENDATGTWYEFKVRDMTTGKTTSAGQLRFPNLGIHSGGGSWTEVYSSAPTEDAVPETDFRISVTGNDSTIIPMRCDTSYNNKFHAADAQVVDRQLILRSGNGVLNVHQPAQFRLDT